MDVFGLCALALGGLFIVLLLRQYHPVFAITVSLALSVVLLLCALQVLMQVRQSLGQLFSWAAGQHYAVVLRVIGIGLIVQTTAELCREAGQPALENKVVLLGKLLILVTALPLFSHVMNLLSELLI